MRTDNSIFILTHAAAVSQSAYCRKPLRRFLRFTREASLSDQSLNRCTRPTVLATDPRDRASDRCSVCLGRSRHRFIRPGVIPTSTPHMDRLLGPGIGQAGSDKVDTAEADEVIDAIAKTVAELTSQRDGVIRQQVIEQLMRQIMHYDGEFRREEATPQSALTRSPDGGSGRLEHGSNSTPGGARWTGRGGSLGVHKSRHRFIRPGVNPTSTPHMDRLLGPRLRNRTSRLRQSRYRGSR